MKLPHPSLTIFKKANPVNLAKVFVNGAKAASGTLAYVVSFSVLLLLYALHSLSGIVLRVPFLPQSVRRFIVSPFELFYRRMLAHYRHSASTMNRMNMIELAIRNMQFKKSRTMITVGGMAVGVGIIVFLLSVGFGIQEMVIGRVARLEELRQADVTVQTGSALTITDKTISDINDLPNADAVLPLIAVVGRVNFQNSITDVAVYGVTADYLTTSATRPIRGKLFESNDLVVSTGSVDDGVVAGVSYTPPPVEESLINVGDEIQPVDFTIAQEAWVPVRSAPSVNGALLGYTRRVEGTQSGTEVWGGRYTSDSGAGGSEEVPFGKWVRTTVYLWEQGECDSEEDNDCIDGEYSVLREGEGLLQREGYMGENDLILRVGVTEGDVLGDSVVQSEVLAETATDSSLESSEGSEEVVLAETSADRLLAEIELLLQQETSGSAVADIDEADRVPLSPRASREAVVNRALLDILNLSESEAVGKTFDVSFVVVGSLTDSDTKIESQSSQYTIVGVDPDNLTPFFYVPFIDLRTLGITNYSQLKVVASEEEKLASLREQVQGLGYNTASVADTVEQITGVFATARILLAMLGSVALAVAALGMFNTLTVSLLERTREVGLMKAMGMKSHEVRELFLTESMIMGFVGGALGIFLGFATGELLGFLLSLYSYSRGYGVVDVSTTPFSLVALTMLFSLIVGLVTGFYPARRATRISALNAMRYE